MMPGDRERDRDRFLIALGKFLGENPTKENPSASILSERWLLDEVVDVVLRVDGGFRIDLHRFNRLMLLCGRGLCTVHFYDYFFRSVDTLEGFESAVEKYRIKAMWLFGNFRYGYKKSQLAT